MMEAHAACPVCLAYFTFPRNIVVGLVFQSCRCGTTQLPRIRPEPARPTWRTDPRLRLTEDLACMVCHTPFRGRRGTKCCSRACGHTLSAYTNHQKHGHHKVHPVPLSTFRLSSSL